jgi:hypothetical protein
LPVADPSNLFKAWNPFCKGERIDKLSVKDTEEGLDKLETPKGDYKARYDIGFKPEQ